jgi:hypothetical protein
VHTNEEVGLGFRDHVQSTVEILWMQKVHEIRAFKHKERNKYLPYFKAKQLKSNKPLVVVVCCCLLLLRVREAHILWALKSFIHSFIHFIPFFKHKVVCFLPKNSTFPNALKKKVLFVFPRNLVNTE